MSGNTRARWRLPLAAALVVANLALIGLNLAKQEIIQVGFLPWGDEAVEGAEPQAEGDLAAEGDPTESGSDAPVESPGTTDGETTVDPADGVGNDGFGGDRPAPDSAPVIRRAIVSNDGTMTLTGSAPDWSTASKIAQYAGARLAGGEAAVDNQLTWHPDANPSTQWGDVVMEEAATFPDGAAVLEPDNPGLDVAAQLLVDNPAVFAVIIGHADSQGEEVTNAVLAAERAAAVVDYLVSQGVVPGQLVVASSGEDQPLATNETDEGRARNRRVEIQFKNVLTSRLVGG